MSDCILKSLPHLLVLCKASPKLTRVILAEENNDDLINALTEIFVNVIESKVLICPTARRILKKSKLLDLLVASENKKKKKNFNKLKKNQFIKYGPRVIPLVLPSVLKQIYSGNNNDDGGKKILPAKSK